MERIKKIKTILPIVLSLCLFFIPFLWFKPGEIDLGGDSSRLYFYNPFAYLISHTLYGISSSGTGIENISYYGFPFIVTLIFLKFIFQSPSLLTIIFHSISLVVAFLSVYAIVRTILIESKFHISKQILYIASSISGILYVFSPGLTEGWQNAILTHNQFFLNPFLFYLFLRFVLSNNIHYLFVATLTSFIFSPNFSFGAAPAIFSFYPLSIIFLFSYSYILKKKFSLKKIILAFLIFILVQSFHLIPQIQFLFDPTSAGNQIIFSNEAKYTRGLEYFISTAQSVKTSSNFFLLQQSNRTGPFDFLFVIFPIIFLFAFFFNKQKTYLLVASFFLVVLFFSSANVTTVGLDIYKSLFSLPGFSMFRNYYGQWSFTLSFYYTMLFGLGVAMILQKMKNTFRLFLVILLISIIPMNAYQFVRGDLIKGGLFKASNKTTFVSMDPSIEKTLSFIRDLPIDGKILTLPFTDPGYQMFRGENGGIYQGPSLIAYTAGRKDFPGNQVIDPYSTAFLSAALNKNYEDMHKILALLNIKYIFYNADPQIYDAFPEFPYDEEKSYFPKKQVEYKQFVTKLASSQIGKFGQNYFVYSLDNSNYLPHIYAAKENLVSNDPASASLFLNTHDIRMNVSSISKGEASILNKEVFIKLNNASPLAYLKNNYHLHTHAPFISRSPLSILYPFVVIKEKNEFSAAKENIEDYLTTGLFLASKRVAEIELFGNDMQLQNNDRTKSKVLRIGKYYLWETSFSRYKTLIESLIDANNHSNIQNFLKEKNRIIIQEQLIKHEEQIYKAIENSIKSSMEKKYLFSKSEELFQSLYREVNLPIISSQNILYTFDSKDIPLGEYYLYIKRIDTSNGITPSLQYLNHIYKPSQTTDKYLIYGPITLKKGENTVYFLSGQSNSVNITNEAINNKGVMEPNGILSLTNESNSPFEGFTHKISQWEAGEQYVITFDYKTNGDNFLFRLYEKKKDKKNAVHTDISLEKMLHSNYWKTHQSIITADINSIMSYLQFINDSSNEKAKVEIRNLTITKVIDPTMFLIKNIQQSPPNQNTPTVTFKKINPTRYVIHISNFNSPFMLVFLDAFSNKWKIYEDTEKRNLPIVASYFGGDIQEAKSENNFFDLGISSLFLTPKVSEEKHSMVNGYANGWVLDPNDFGNKKDINLVIDFTTQHLFQVGLIISGITVLFVVGYLVYNFLHEAFKFRFKE